MSCCCFSSSSASLNAIFNVVFSTSIAAISSLACSVTSWMAPSPSPRVSSNWFSKSISRSSIRSRSSWACFSKSPMISSACKISLCSCWIRFSLSVPNTVSASFRSASMRRSAAFASASFINTASSNSIAAAAAASAAAARSTVNWVSRRRSWISFSSRAAMAAVSAASCSSNVCSRWTIRLSNSPTTLTDWMLSSRCAVRCNSISWICSVVWDLYPATSASKTVHLSSKSAMVCRNDANSRVCKVEACRAEVWSRTRAKVLSDNSVWSAVNSSWRLRSSTRETASCFRRLVSCWWWWD
mmetsp:Transcript_16214/g.29196  ORF Transcript_16214/g.29196 Transcript_16214/m.29196 type:complete len:299 (+) Transcript_16214:366-1262(+)